MIKLPEKSWLYLIKQPEAAAEKADEAIETEETFVELIVGAVLEAAEKADEAVLEATGEIFRIKAASRHTIVFRPGNY